MRVADFSASRILLYRPTEIDIGTAPDILE
jgi:hypothetical protein